MKQAPESPKATTEISFSIRRSSVSRDVEQRVRSALWDFVIIAKTATRHIKEMPWRAIVLSSWAHLRNDSAGSASATIRQLYLWIELSPISLGHGHFEG